MSGFVGLGRQELVLEEELTPFNDYRAAVLGMVRPLDPMHVRVGDALGLVLAEDVVAAEPLPGFANSAMDGYAVLSADVAAATQDDPITLRVVGEAAAGSPDGGVVTAGTAIAIMTGAVVPAGADAVVPVERTTQSSDGTVAVHAPADVGAHIRTVGQDVSVGTHVLSAGTRLGPPDIALLAALGHAEVMAHPTPRVVVLSTGDELVTAGRQPGPGQLRDSNGPMVRAMVHQVGATPYASPIVGDDPRKLAAALDSSTGHADLIVTTGGVSAGAHDHLQSVMRQLGEVYPHKVAMKPGMPQLVGRIDRTPLIGLPGNPVSTFVSFELFVRPAIRRLQGRTDLDRPRVRATLTESMRSPRFKRTFIRVTLERRDGRWFATPSGSQGSHVLSSLARADGLAVIPEHTTEAAAGTAVVVHLLVD